LGGVKFAEGVTHAATNATFWPTVQSTCETVGAFDTTKLRLSRTQLRRVRVGVPVYVPRKYRVVRKFLDSIPSGLVQAKPIISLNYPPLLCSMI
jgi:hypothetical protein